MALFSFSLPCNKKIKKIKKYIWFYFSPKNNASTLVRNRLLLKQNQNKKFIFLKFYYLDYLIVYETRLTIRTPYITICKQNISCSKPYLNLIIFQ